MASSHLTAASVEWPSVPGDTPMLEKWYLFSIPCPVTSFTPESCKHLEYWNDARAKYLLLDNTSE